MTRSRILTLDEVIDPTDATVRAEIDGAGQVIDAHFDLSGLPRVDPLLIGHPVREVPRLVERLCGICPAAHHLAGMRALDALYGLRPSPQADAVRRVVHYASILESFAPRLLPRDPASAVALRRLARTALGAAGSPGHFPATAAPGGVRTGLDDALRREARALTAPALAALTSLREEGTLPPFAGIDVALVDDRGEPDLFGVAARLCVAADPVVADLTPAQWTAAVAESRPGASAPRPFIVALGPKRGRYRVGPVAQLRIGPLTTPLAAAAQKWWLATSGGAGAARGVIALHALEMLDATLARTDLEQIEVRAEPVHAPPLGATGTGWVDSSRGLLVHSYTVGPGGLVATAQITTPTAQNEPWLSGLLRGALRDADPGDAAVRARLEDAIRAADPCLPCSSVPPGTMALDVVISATDRTD